MTLNTKRWLVFLACVAVGLVTYAQVSWSHDGPRQEWYDWDSAGNPIIEPAGEWWGYWQVCYDDTSCSEVYSYHTFSYQHQCEQVTNQNLDGTLAQSAKDGRLVTSWTSACSEDPVAAGWPSDPRDPCIHPRNWWNSYDECLDEINAWLAQVGGDPAPVPDPDPTPDPDPVPQVTYTWGTVDVGSTNIVVRWTISEASTGQTDYGTTPTPDASWQIHGPELTYRLDHGQNIGGLTPGTTYYYRISGESESGATYQSEIRSVTTTQ